ncbi:hypothetical protein [Herbaspirillum huttiense]|uniref:Uncharacterized protein n=1 Tax=Herbaspirillum huttiense subsp. lycopersici TaxID=3074428 RepID=A0ABU2EU91_9BURK|nr:hypothetical protein [Herbaspirillum huttiense]MDR9851746.1 hypothetical protein [Herbaspirillum huttiense SE1]
MTKIEGCALRPDRNIHNRNRIFICEINMTAIREYGLVLVLATASAATFSQSFEQRGPTGDNRAVTGNPGTQQPPTGNSKAVAKKKQPLKDEQKKNPKQSTDPDAAAPTASPGTPAENNAQPDSSK